MLEDVSATDAVRTAAKKMPTEMSLARKVAHKCTTASYALARKALKKIDRADSFDIYMADSILISLGKAGSTWLRLMLGKVFVDHFRLRGVEPAEWTKIQSSHPDIPRILHLNEKYTLDYDRFVGKDVILLARDPRDGAVSTYFQLSRRFRREDKYQGTLTEMLDDPRWGFDRKIETYNGWAEHRSLARRLLLVRYEDMVEDAAAELARILEFIGLQIDEALIHDAVAFATFENMRKMEEQSQFAKHSLRPVDKDDPESFKTRKGKVGGYADYLSPEDVAALDDKMRLLSQYYGYHA